MNIKIILGIYLIFFSFSSRAQQFIFEKSIGNFTDASAFFISPIDFIYVTDLNNNEIIKLSLSGELLTTAGGTGWSDDAFDSPVDIFASILYVLVADKNNHAIKLFDKDLNFNSVLYTNKIDNTVYQFGFPISCVYSKQGDMYILDSENKRIVKFDMFRNFSSTFGGFDYGNFSLSNPSKIAINNNNEVFVLNENKLFVFDQFGTGIRTIELDTNFIDIKIISDNLTLTSHNCIYYSKLVSGEVKLSKIEIDFGDYEPVSSILYKNNLYILTKTNILVFKSAN